MKVGNCVSAMGALIVGAAILAGCSSNTGSDAAGGGESPAVDAVSTNKVVTKFEVISTLEPLTKAVVAYTNTDYGDDVSSPAVLAQVESNLAAIQLQEESWRAFTSSIDYDESAISGLSQAVAGYNEGLDTWQAKQERGLANWKQCVAEGGGDLTIAACMTVGYSLEEEQQALDAYTTPLKALLETLGAL